VLFGFASRFLCPYLLFVAVFFFCLFFYFLWFVFYCVIILRRSFRKSYNRWRGTAPLLIGITVGWPPSMTATTSSLYQINADDLPIQISSSLPFNSI